jgi:D-alanyl-D-alanine carboxypeptidase/D-alanyl-D-alanine-endopeptidase (penicillin-binding protein 4)
VAARGVTSVAGRYLVWGGALPRLPRIDAEQPAHVGYNPAVSGLNLNFNRVHFEWRRAGKGWDVTMDARAERFLPQVRMARMKIETRETPLFTYEQAAGEERWTVASAALGKGGARWMPVRLPELYAGEVFQTLLAAHGLKLPDPLVIDNLPSAEVLAEDRSDTLDVVLRDMLEFSTNLTAELVGLSASKAPSLLASSQAMTQWAARFGPGLGFVDHSGLGGASRVTAAGMVRALVAAQAGPLAGLMKDHGMRDAEGKPIKGHPVSVRAKTGTLNFASGLAGYISPPGGRRLAFAIFAADPARRAALTEAEREQPEGGAVWTRRARLLQARLIDRWAGLYA